MKAKSKLKILGIFILGICIGTTISNGAVEIKSGGTAHTSVTISQAYEYCYNMRSGTSSLGNNSLDPHLSLNADWGAVAYLGVSPYGTVRNKKGDSVTEGTTTTRNITGVINFGKNYTFVSSLKTESTENLNPEYRTKLTENLETKYVENLKGDADTNIGNAKGMALAETSGWFSTSKLFGSSYPCLVRTGVFGYDYHYYNASYGPQYYYGLGSSSSATFRPVIWN